MVESFDHSLPRENSLLMIPKIGVYYEYFEVLLARGKIPIVKVMMETEIMHSLSMANVL